MIGGPSVSLNLLEPITNVVRHLMNITFSLLIILENYLLLAALSMRGGGGRASDPVESLTERRIGEMDRKYTKYAFFSVLQPEKCLIDTELSIQEKESHNHNNSNKKNAIVCLGVSKLLLGRN